MIKWARLSLRQAILSSPHFKVLNMTKVIVSGEVVFAAYSQLIFLPETEASYKQVVLVLDDVGRAFRSTSRRDRPRGSDLDFMAHVRAKLEALDPNLPIISERVGRYMELEKTRLVPKGTPEHQVGEILLRHKEEVNAGIRHLAQEARPMGIEVADTSLPSRKRWIHFLSNWLRRPFVATL